MACFCSWQTIRIGCCLRFVPAAWSCGSSLCRSPFWWRHWRKTSLKPAVRRWPLRPGAAEAGWGRPGAAAGRRLATPDRGIRTSLQSEGPPPPASDPGPHGEAEAGAVGPHSQPVAGPLDHRPDLPFRAAGAGPPGKSAGLQPHLPGAVPRGGCVGPFPDFSTGERVPRRRLRGPGLAAPVKF